MIKKSYIEPRIHQKIELAIQKHYLSNTYLKTFTA
jgi:hypothetical protein